VKKRAQKWVEHYCRQQVNARVLDIPFISYEEFCKNPLKTCAPIMNRFGIQTNDNPEMRVRGKPNHRIRTITDQTLRHLGFLQALEIEVVIETIQESDIDEAACAYKNWSRATVNQILSNDLVGAFEGVKSRLKHDGLYALPKGDSKGLDAGSIF